MTKTTLTLLLLLSCLYLALICRNNIRANANPSILVVGPDEFFKRIQDAINNASSGDIVHVRPGIYYENIIINKSITLMGENRNNTIIDGRGIGNIVSIQASNVSISGFTIQKSDPDIGCGVYVERVVNIIIRNNNITNNGVGILLKTSDQNQICENIVSANYDIGVQLRSSSGNVICRNVVIDNLVGIDVYYYSMSNTIYENTFSGNGWGVYISWNSNNNIFYYNNFIGNYYNVDAKQTTNTWSANNKGNYWHNYEGNDSNKDGVGDAPYSIDGKNIDYYPLMGIYRTFIASFGGNIYRVAVISNSTIIDFKFKIVAETKVRVILFNASSNGNSASFSRVVIPKALMRSIHTVLVNEEEVDATLLNVENAENIYLYIEHLGDCSIKIVYSELLDLYYQLLFNYTELLDKYRDLNESYFMLLNATLQNLLRDYSELLNEFNVVNLLYRDQTQNFRGLTYIFAATTVIFILTTIYFSKKVHEKVAKSKVNE